MPPVVRTLMSQAPGVNIECIQGDGKFCEGISSGTIDLACFAFPLDTKDIIVRPLCPVDLVVVSRRNHPAITRPLDLETLQGLTQIALGRELRGLTNIDKDLIARGVPRRVGYMAAKIWSIPPMVERTDLVGILPRRFVQEISGNFALDIHEMPIEMPEQFLYMMWHANNELDPGHKWLRESMMQAAHSNL
jgi:DNA-binding transcriptional LysR family regulator